MYRYLTSSIILLLFSVAMLGQETNIMVRAKAKDAKFIGSSVGGAQILVKDALTGEILDKGLTSGSTGNTKKIMKEPHERYNKITDDKTAGFKANLDIKEPLFVKIEAYAPANKKQAQVISSTELWVIPGKDIVGDGVVLEIPGFIVDILSPQTHEVISGKNTTELKANIVMMCGCPIEKGGLWDANQYEVKALVKKEGGATSKTALEQKEKTSTFSASIDLSPGLYEITIYAYDPITGNTGVDKTNIIVK